MDRIDQMIVQLQAQEKDYAQRAFYEALRQLLKAQAQRLALAEAEVDGRTWNHEQW